MPAGACAARLASAYRRHEAMPSLVPRLHSTGRAHLCHSCTRGLLEPDDRQTDLPDTDGVPAGRPACPSAGPVELAREGPPLLVNPHTETET
jgi:hypothetical protein